MYTDAEPRSTLGLASMRPSSPCAEMPSSELSPTVLDPDGGNEAGMDPLSLLLSVKKELESVLQQALVDKNQDPSLGNVIAEKAAYCIKSLGDLRELDCDEITGITEKFFEFVAVLSDLFENLKKKTPDDVEPLSGALDECIARGQQIVASDFELKLDERFERMTDTVLKICIGRQPYSKRHYVALIKIHNRLLEKVDEPILRQSHVAELVHSMGTEIHTSLTSDSDQNWKLVAFLLKRIVYLSNKCEFRSDDPRFIGTLANLYELRLSDHPLNKLVEKVELWKLVDSEGLQAISNEGLGIGFVLLCCDLGESMLKSQENRPELEFCIRTIYRRAQDVVKYMFHRTGRRPVFDHCLHILCEGLASMKCSSLLDEISEENISLEQRLLHDEVCRYFGRKDIVKFDPVETLASLGHTHSLKERSEEDLRTFLGKASDYTPMRPLSTPLDDTRVKPCSPNSALLFSLVSQLNPLTTTNFLERAAELAEIMTANPGNDCLFLFACNFFTFVRDFALCNVEDLSKQAPIVMLKEIVSRLSPNPLMNAFGATSLIIFAFGTDNPKWLNLRSPSHENYFRAFERSFDFDHWRSTLHFLGTGDSSARAVNTYVEPPEPTLDLLKLPAPPETVPQESPASVPEVYSRVLALESSCDIPTADEIAVLKRCIEKLEKVLERALQS